MLTPDPARTVTTEYTRRIPAGRPLSCQTLADLLCYVGASMRKLCRQPCGMYNLTVLEPRAFAGPEVLFKTLFETPKTTAYLLQNSEMHMQQLSTYSSTPGGTGEAGPSVTVGGHKVDSVQMDCL